MSGSFGTFFFPVLPESNGTSKGCRNLPTFLIFYSLPTTVVYGKYKHAVCHRQVETSLGFPFNFRDIICLLIYVFINLFLHI